MTDDRSLERAARSWLEEGPTRAPDLTVDAALARIQTTRQERDLLVLRRMPTMNPIIRLAGVAALVLAVSGAVYLAMRPASDVGPASSPTPMPSASVFPTRLTAGPLEIGTYVGPTLQVADIVAAANADTTLTPSERVEIIAESFAIKDHSTWTPSLEFRGGQMTERQSVDGIAQIGSFGAYSFPDDHTLVITDTANGTEGVTRFELTIDGDSFTLQRLTPAADAAEEFVLDTLFESGPFTLQ